MAYMTLVHLAFLNCSFDVWTQVFLLVLGAAGTVASNPFGLLWRSMGGAAVGQFFLELYIAFFRMFAFAQLEMVGRKRAAPRPPLLVAAVIFFGALAGTDSSVELTRAHPRQAGARLWTALTALNVCYLVLAVVAAILAWHFSGGWSCHRVVFFGACLAVDAGACLSTRLMGWVGSEFAFSIVPRTVKAAFPLTAGAFAVFLMQADAGLEYQQVDDVDEISDLAVDEISSGGSTAGFSEGA
jgi:hypothetical protein